MPDIPNWWEAALLGGAAFRTWRLAAKDLITDPLRRKFLRLGNDWQEEGDDVPDNYRVWWGEMFRCPWCLGFWIVIIAWVAWLIFPTETLWVSVPLFLSAGVGLVAKLDSEE